MKKKLFVFFVFICFVLLCYPLFLKKTFGPVSFEQFLFHLMNPLKGTDPRLYYKGVGYAFILPVFLTVLYFKPAWFAPKKFKGVFNKWSTSKLPVYFSFVLFIASIAFQLYVLRIDKWYYGHMHPSTLFKDYYLTQKAEDITFKEKKNAIVIYLESMENTYGDFSVFNKNYIPELTNLAQENTSFTRFYQLAGTQWTIAGLFNGMCGMPLKIPLKGIRLDLFKTFLPGAVCIPEILQAHDYTTGLIIGSEAVFSGVDNLANQHGFDRYWGIKEIEDEKGKITPEMKGKGWGLNDEAMFNFAKEKITAASQKDKPFFYVLMTIDTHFPNGYFNPYVCKHIENNFTDVVSCSSRVINDFVDWVKAQPFAKDTTIILLGDHLTMGNDVIDTIRKNPKREVINIFINGSKTADKTKQRKYATFDFAPTILSSMGAILPKDAFGLGRDLFSDTPTVTEQVSPEKLSEEIQKYSPEYQEFFKERTKK